MSDFKAMKFKITSPEHSVAVQSKLFEMGYAWCGHIKEVKYTDANSLFAGTFGGNEITYDWDEKYFNAHKTDEYVLTPWGAIMAAKDYYKQPVTSARKKYCKGCNVLTCTGCGESYEESPQETTYEPLPLQPFGQWIGDRMKLLSEHIAHGLSKGDLVKDEVVYELCDLNCLLRNYKENN